MALHIPAFRESLAKRPEYRQPGAALATLRFTYGTSRAAETYGYNVVSLYLDDDFAARCSGGGYDMKGTCLGTFIANAFGPELLAIAHRASSVFHEDTKKNEHKPHNAPGVLYGFTVYMRNGKPVSVRCDGGCGFRSMESILEAIGYTLHWVGRAGSRADMYTLHQLTKAEA